MHFIYKKFNIYRSGQATVTYYSYVNKKKKNKVYYQNLSPKLLDRKKK